MGDFDPNVVAAFRTRYEDFLQIRQESEAANETLLGV